MRWKIGITIEPHAGYKMDALCELISRKGFEPVYCGPSDGTVGAIERLSKYEALIAGGDTYSQNILRSLKEKGKIKIIARFGVGYDKIDMDEASRLGIAITNTTGTMSKPVAEMTLSLLLSAARFIEYFDRKLRDGVWVTGPIGYSLEGKTIGIIGFGAIARQFVEYIKGFNCTILAYDSFFDEAAAKKLNVKYADLDMIARESDFISFHLPKTPETVNIWNKKNFVKMKPTSVLINTSRGGIVNEKDLIWALENKVIGAAGIDVFEIEPLPHDNPLLKLDNVVMAPHAAAWNEVTELLTGGRALDNIIDLYEGRIPRNIVNPDYAKNL